MFTAAPPRQKVLAGLAVAVGLALLALVASAVMSDADTGEGTGKLEVAGRSYKFTPTTCVISPDEFLASGSGVHDGEQFWVSATPVAIDLAVGTESEIDQPAEDQLWLVSDEADPVAWEVDEDRVSARATMIDTRTADGTRFRAVLEVRCRDLDA